MESALVIGVNPAVGGPGGAANYTIMRTPGHDRELTVGFLFTEGIINSLDDIAALTECPETPNSIAVTTTGPVSAPASRNLVVSSSCGLCGRADIDALLKRLGKIRSDIRINSDILYDLPDAVKARQALFQATGAAHAAALFDEHGSLMVVREDVGRHNALDKVIGHALLTAVDLGRLGVFLSGRASLELIIKAARGRLPIVVAVSAPTAAAVMTAEQLGITLAGFARESGFTIYAGADRIDLPASAKC